MYICIFVCTPWHSVPNLDRRSLPFQMSVPRCLVVDKRPCLPVPAPARGSIIQNRPAYVCLKRLLSISTPGSRVKQPSASSHWDAPLAIQGKARIAAPQLALCTLPCLLLWQPISTTAPQDITCVVGPVPCMERILASFHQHPWEHTPGKRSSVARKIQATIES
jgi:hypothetical protein